MNFLLVIVFVFLFCFTKNFPICVAKFSSAAALVLAKKILNRISFLNAAKFKKKSSGFPAIPAVPEVPAWFFI